MTNRKIFSVWGCLGLVGLLSGIQPPDLKACRLREGYLVALTGQPASWHKARSTSRLVRWSQSLRALQKAAMWRGVELAGLSPASVHARTLFESARGPYVSIPI